MIIWCILDNELVLSYVESKLATVWFFSFETKDESIICKVLGLKYQNTFKTWLTFYLKDPFIYSIFATDENVPFGRKCIILKMNCVDPIGSLSVF